MAAEMTDSLQAAASPAIWTTTFPFDAKAFAAAVAEATGTDASKLGIMIYDYAPTASIPRRR